MSEPFVPTPSPFTCATFEPLVSDSFVAERDGVAVALELVRARAIALNPIDGRAQGTSGYVRRDPFALLFRGPASPQLRQGLHQFTHAALGEFTMSIVPLGPGASCMLYEAVFN